MATTESDGVGTATCPLCDDYRGKPSSVEGHISRMTDPVHQGEVGRAHRDELHRQVDDDLDEQDDEAGETSSSESNATESREYPSAGGGPHLEDREQESDDQEGDGGGGIPIPVSTTTLVVAVVVLVAVAVYWRGQTSGAGQSEQIDEDTGGRDTNSLGGGLRGA